LDLQLTYSNQYLSSITLWVRISIRTWCTRLCVKVCQWFSPGPSTNKTDRHDISEILLKVALNTIKPTNQCTITLAVWIKKASWVIFSWILVHSLAFESSCPRLSQTSWIIITSICCVQHLDRLCSDGVIVLGGIKKRKTNLAPGATLQRDNVRPHNVHESVSYSPVINTRVGFNYFKKLVLTILIYM
jgi:hypothetical protein